MDRDFVNLINLYILHRNICIHLISQNSITMSSAENQAKNVEEPTTAGDGKQEFENENNGEEEDDVKREDGEDEVDHNGYTKSDFLKIPITVSATKTEVLNLLFTLDISSG